MKWYQKNTSRRIATYLLVSAVGLPLLTATYCAISGRPVLAVIQNLWIAMVFALSTAVVTAIRDQRAEEK